VPSIFHQNHLHQLRPATPGAITGETVSSFRRQPVKLLRDRHYVNLHRSGLPPPGAQEGEREALPVPVKLLSDRQRDACQSQLTQTAVPAKMG
jgi:hypothetical protein